MKIKEDKKNLFFIFIIFGISVLYLLPLMSSGFIIGHDSQVILSREAARIEAIKDGQFPPRWAGDLNYGFGNPSFIFFYPLGGYLLALLHFLNIPLENAYEILLGVSFVLSPVIFYLWVKQFLKTQASFIGAIFYGLSPYLFMNLYVRAHLGELLSFVFIPLVFYFLEKYFKKPAISNLLLGSISYALFIQTHVILSFMFSFIFVFYIIFRTKLQIKPFILNSSILILGLLLSAYFWIPSVIEGRYINSNLFVGDWYAGHFLNFKNILYSAWGFGSSVNEKGGLAPQIGPLHSFFILLSLWLIVKKIKIRKDLIFWLAVFIIGVFMSSSLSSFLWEKIHILQKFQFPWRFIALSSFSVSVLIAYVFSVFNHRFIKVVVLLALFILVIPMVKIPKSQSFGDDHYFNYIGTSTFHNEATTIWVAGDAYEVPKKKIEIIAGIGKIDNFQHKSHLHSFSMNNKSEVKILDNTVYFPGWRAEVDGKKAPIEFQDNNHKGLITFNVPRGQHEVEVRLGESPVRLLSDIISLIAIVGILLTFIFRKWIRSYLKI